MRKFCSTFEILRERLGDLLEKMKETRRRGKPSIPGAHSKQIRSLSRSVQPNRGGEPSHVCGTWCSQINTGAPSSSTPWNGSDRTDALSTTTNIGQRRIATHRRRVAMLGRNLLERLRGRPRPNFNQSHESRLDDAERKLIEGNT